STLSGTLNVSSTGGLTQSQKLTVSGAVSLDVGSKNITLDNASNTFANGVTVAHAGNVSLVDAGTLTFAGTITGNASVVAQKLTLGAVSVAGTFYAKGDFDLSSDVTGSSIEMVSTDFIDMHGHTATATSGNITLLAQGSPAANGYISLGRLVSTNNGSVSVTALNGAITDGLSGSLANIVTGADVSLSAGSGSLAVKLWDSDQGSSGPIDIKAGSLKNVAAPGGVSIGLGGNGNTFTGTLATAGDLVLDLGSAGINMAATSSLHAGHNLTLTSTGNLALSQVSAGSAYSASISTTGAITGVSGVGGANVSGGSILLSAATIGTDAQALTLDAGTVQKVSTSGAATLSVVTALNGDGSTPTVKLGTSTAADDWTIGGALSLHATLANLALQGSLTAASVNLSAAAGSLNMTDGETLNSVGNIALSGYAGLGISTIRGNVTASTTQSVTLSSANGSITDLTSAELANVTTAGTFAASAKSIGSVGVGDIDLDVGRISSVTTTLGAAFLESLSAAGAKVDAATVAGSLNLGVDHADLTLYGNLNAGSLVLNVASGNLTQTDATKMVVAGTVNLSASGNIALARLEGADGAVSLVAGGNILDNSAADTYANLVLTTGALTLEGAHIGSTGASATSTEDLDLDVANIASVLATDSSASNYGFNLSSARSVSVGSLNASGRAVFQQTAGNLTLNRAVRVNAITLGVAAGDLTQEIGATLTVDADLSATVSGNVSLVSMTSLAGNIALTAGGSILDATTETERALLTTSTSGKTITLAAAAIGIDNDSGDIEVDTGKVTAATASTGGVYLTAAHSMEVGALTASGMASVELSQGNLLLSGALSGATAELRVDAGNYTMGDAARISAVTAATLVSTGTMTLSQVAVSATNSMTRLSAGGALLDGSVGEPSSSPAAWNVDAAGMLEISAAGIGASDNAFDIRTPTLNQLTTSGDAWLQAGSVTGGTTMVTVDAGTQALSLTLLGGDLTLNGSLSAGTLALEAESGRFVMADGSRANVVGDLAARASGDVLLTQLVTEDGLVTVAAGGKIVDNSADELANIVGTDEAARASLSATQIGAGDASGEQQTIGLSGVKGGTYKLSLTVDGTTH
ncbi:MAG: beta strand repeat-containing protein, partial [Rhodoferax sp.]